MQNRELTQIFENMRDVFAHDDYALPLKANLESLHPKKLKISSNSIDFWTYSIQFPAEIYFAVTGLRYAGHSIKWSFGWCWGNMVHNQSHEAAANKYGKLAFDMMKKHKVEPMPVHYELFYHYVSGEHPGLVAALDSRINCGSAISDAFLSEIFNEHFQTEDELSNAAANAGAQLDTQIDKILESLDTNVGHASRFGDALRGVSENLSNNTSQSDLALIVKTVVSATEQMESRSRELETQLQESKSEVSTLRTNLDAVRLEARTDALTGLANRKAFDDGLLEAVQNSVEQEAPLCLVMSDIDHFKAFNDSWGHQTGDQVLKLVAGSIRSCVKGRDTSARYGGEEFAIILPGTQLNDATMIANQVRETIHSRELVKKSTGENLGRVTMSFGIAVFRPGEPISDLIERADECLYAAKHGGRNQVISELNSAEILTKSA